MGSEGVRSSKERELGEDSDQSAAEEWDLQNE